MIDGEMTSSVINYKSNLKKEKTHRIHLCLFRVLISSTIAYCFCLHCVDTNDWSAIWIDNGKTNNSNKQSLTSHGSTLTCHLFRRLFDFRCWEFVNPVDLVYPILDDEFGNERMLVWMTNVEFLLIFLRRTGERCFSVDWSFLMVIFIPSNAR